MINCINNKKLKLNIHFKKNFNGFQDFTQDSIDKINSELFIKNKNVIDTLLTNLDQENIINDLEEENSEISEQVEIILNSLGQRGILTFLGIRTTPGSADSFLPPNLDFLMEKFRGLHTKECSHPNKKSSILTVGGRALCKHTHRSGDVN
jgi:hypothetical protein